MWSRVAGRLRSVACERPEEMRESPEDNEVSVEGRHCVISGESLGHGDVVRIGRAESRGGSKRNIALLDTVIV